MGARTMGIYENTVLSRTSAQCGLYAYAALFENELTIIKREFSWICAYYASITLFYGLPEDRVPSANSGG